MKFSDIQNQSEVVAHLRRSVDEGRVSHAQMFVGNPMAGGLPLAVAYAQYLNCTNRQGGEPCGVCPSCRKMEELVHPDIHFIYPVARPTGWKSTNPPISDDFLPQFRELFKRTDGYFDERMWYDELGFENQQVIISRHEADEIVRKLSFKSFEATYKIVIVWLPESMRTEAANVLLKILEEPWERTIFLLVAHHTEQMLSTILSRTQQTILPYLTPRRTESEADEQFEAFSALMRLCYSNKHLDMFEWVESMVASGREAMKRFLEYSVSMLRESYLKTAGLGEISYLSGAEEGFIAKFAPFITSENIEALVGECETALRDISQNGNPRIVFTHFALTISKLIGKN